MMNLFNKCFDCLISVILVVVGFVLRLNNATAFLGLIAWGIAAVILAYFVLRKISNKYPKVSKCMTMLFTIVLCVGFVAACITGVFVGRAAAGSKEGELQYIIVLGAKVNGTQPSRTLRERIDAAAVYLQENPNIIAIASGGQGSDEGISEAQCVYNGLVQRGITSERIWLEDQATSTRENLVFSLDLVEDKTGIRPEKIGLVSSEFHLYRASLYAKECGAVSYGIPAKTSNPIYFMNYYLREIVGVWYFILFGN